MLYFLNSILIITNQLTDYFRKVINHSRQGLWWTLPRIHGSGGLGTEISEKETGTNTHHTILKGIKGEAIPFNPNIRLGRNKACWGCSTRERGAQMQSKQAATIRSKGLASSLKSTAERKPHAELGRWTGNRKPVLYKLVCMCLHCTIQHTSARVQRWHSVTYKWW